MSKVLKPIKKLIRQAKENPIVSIGVGIFALLIVGAVIAVAVFTGGDGEGDKADKGDSKAETSELDEKDPAIEKARKRKVKPAPVRSSPGTLDVARSVGAAAVAQGRGRLKSPSSISVRVSAAPKQKVTVNYQLACYREGTGTKIGKGTYTPRPPDVRSLPLPLAGARECTVTVGAQLTSLRPGRIKVAIISG